MPYSMKDSKNIDKFCKNCLCQYCANWYAALNGNQVLKTLLSVCFSSSVNYQYFSPSKFYAMRYKAVYDDPPTIVFKRHTLFT